MALVPLAMVKSFETPGTVVPLPGAVTQERDCTIRQGWPHNQLR